MAARYSDVPKLTRLTPAAASSATEKERPRIAIMKFTGRESARETAPPATTMKAKQA
jgi:hypothetical protein